MADTEDEQLELRTRGAKVAKRRIAGRFRAAVIVASLLLYAFASLLPAAFFSVASNDTVASGFSLLIFGWMDPQGTLPWLSNFFFFAGLVFFGFSRANWAFGCSGVGLLCASRVLLDYSGAVVLLEAKYWWLASQGVLFVGSLSASVWAWVVALSPKLS
jgi:hypothetical protein